MKTTNAGTNWIIQNQPATDKYLYSISPVNANVCYCVGWFETILKTTNGGDNWFAIRNGPDATGASYWASYFINENTGWIAGSNQKILKTTNGGLTLDSIYLFVGNIMDLYFKDSLNGFLCGEGGLTRKTTNGGLNWFEPNIQLNGNLYNFYKVSFVNNYGWLVGNINPVYRSTDFGMNWDSIGYISGSDEIYFSVFSSVLTGWAGGTYGRMFKTTNGGYNWSRENTTSFTGYIEEGYFYNDSIGWIVGGGGRIQYTTSSGQVMKITKNNEQIANKFALFQNYPNPFNSQTNIEFEVNKNGFYEIAIYDVTGRKMDVIFNKYLEKGSYKTTYDAGKLSSGVYFYTLINGIEKKTKSFLLIK